MVYEDADIGIGPPAKEGNIIDFLLHLEAGKEGQERREWLLSDFADIRYASRVFVCKAFTLRARSVIGCSGGSTVPSYGFTNCRTPLAIEGWRVLTITRRGPLTGFGSILRCPACHDLSPDADLTGFPDLPDEQLRRSRFLRRGCHRPPSGGLRPARRTSLCQPYETGL